MGAEIEVRSDRRWVAALLMSWGAVAIAGWAAVGAASVDRCAWAHAKGEFEEPSGCSPMSEVIFVEGLVGTVLLLVGAVAARSGLFGRSSWGPVRTTTPWAWPVVVVLAMVAVLGWISIAASIDDVCTLSSAEEDVLGERRSCTSTATEVASEGLVATLLLVPAAWAVSRGAVAATAAVTVATAVLIGQQVVP